MKVLLFDLDTAGHHLEYASHVARYLREQGDEVLFAMWGKPSAPDASATLDSFSDVRHLARRRSSGQTSSATLPIAIWQGAFRCLQLAKREQVDVIHFLYLDRSELAILVATLLRSRPAALFGTLFWPYFVHQDSESNNAVKRLFHGVSERSLSSLLSRDTMRGLFVHSERIKNLIAGRLSDPSLAERIVVVPDPAKQAPDMTSQEARAALRLPSATPIILFFGRARLDKGPDILLQALVGLDGDWITVLAGEPGVVGEIEAETHRRLLGDASRLVTRFGYVPEVDADRYFRAADVVVLPYRRTFRGTSGVLQRAAASGKPVIVTSVGDVGSIVREFGLGTVIPAESPDHLNAALHDFLRLREQVQQDVAPRALEYAKANDWRVLGVTTRATYLSCLGPQQR
jgi:glycosyltransferase involved in cell wall biosynthesis